MQTHLDRIPRKGCSKRRQQQPHLCYSCGGSLGGVEAGDEEACGGAAGVLQAVVNDKKLPQKHKHEHLSTVQPRERALCMCWCVIRCVWLEVFDSLAKPGHIVRQSCIRERVVYSVGVGQGVCTGWLCSAMSAKAWLYHLELAWLETSNPFLVCVYPGSAALCWQIWTRALPTLRHCTFF